MGGRRRCCCPRDCLIVSDDFEGSNVSPSPFGDEWEAKSGTWSMGTGDSIYGRYLGVLGGSAVALNSHQHTSEYSVLSVDVALLTTGAIPRIILNSDEDGTEYHYADWDWSNAEGDGYTYMRLGYHSDGSDTELMKWKHTKIESIPPGRYRTFAVCLGPNGPGGTVILSASSSRTIESPYSIDTNIFAGNKYAGLGNKGSASLRYNNVVWYDHVINNPNCPCCGISSGKETLSTGYLYVPQYLTWTITGAGKCVGSGILKRDPARWYLGLPGSETHYWQAVDAYGNRAVWTCLDNGQVNSAEFRLYADACVEDWRDWVLDNAGGTCPLFPIGVIKPVAGSNAPFWLQYALALGSGPPGCQCCTGTIYIDITT